MADSHSPANTEAQASESACFRATRASACRAGHHRRTAPPRLRHRCQLLPPDPGSHRRRRIAKTTCSTCLRPQRGRTARPVTFRAAGTSLSGQAITDGVLAVDRRRLRHLRNRRRRRHGPARPRHHRRRGQSPSRSVRPEDRPRPGLDRRRQDRRHRRQQRLRHVLRHRAEQLPDAGRPARHARRRHRARYRGPAQRRRASRTATPVCSANSTAWAATRAPTPRWPGASATSSRSRTPPATASTRWSITKTRSTSWRT